MSPNARRYSRRHILASASAGAAWAALGGAPPARAVTVAAQSAPFDLAWLQQRVREMATKPYEPPRGALPAPLPDLSYQQYREIRFRPDQALWRDQGLTFEVQFFHLGYQYRDPVRIFEVADGMAREVTYAPSLFDFGKSGVDPAGLTGLGFAGFRLHYPLNRPDYYDELLVFLGASYFRSLGRGETFGLSARGLAINTGLPEGEEFPAFRSFWLERPRPGATALNLHALLDSPSIVGAYSFGVHPGDRTVTEISAFLLPRTAAKLTGVAPLTSMYFFGENDRLGVDDYRPEVHDSDGLAIWHASGEWLWRPLINPGELAITSFGDDSPRGFGLLQRDRRFESYQDLFSHPELRPSLWVEPLDGWGKGDVRLIEIPSEQEIHDNIVAFWAPEKPFAAGQATSLNYRLHWGQEPPVQPTGATVRATRAGRGTVDNSRRYVIDFAGGELARIGQDATVEAVTSASTGKAVNVLVQPNPALSGWRASFDFVPDDDSPADLRCFLRMKNKVLSETWSYRWTR